MKNFLKKKDLGSVENCPHFSFGNWIYKDIQHRCVKVVCELWVCLIPFFPAPPRVLTSARVGRYYDSITTYIPYIYRHTRYGIRRGILLSPLYRYVNYLLFHFYQTIINCILYNLVLTWTTTL